MSSGNYVLERELPHISFTLPISASKKDAEDYAKEWINNKLGIKSYEVMHVELMQEGIIKTKTGLVDGRLYMVAFMQTDPQIIYLHPNYDKIINRK